MAARSSQDLACCCRATESARSKYASALAASGSGEALHDFASNAMNFSFPPLFLSFVYCRHRLLNAAPRMVD